MTYSFQSQLEQGKTAEDLMDAWLWRFCKLWPASKGDDLAGIDRWARHMLTGHKFSLQYKADTRAVGTGNAFVEICSICREGKCIEKGWAYTCQADWLFYLAVGGGPLFIVPTSVLGHQADNWRYRFPEKEVSSQGYRERYSTKGLIVPLEEFGRIAKIVIEDFEQWQILNR